MIMTVAVKYWPGDKSFTVIYHNEKNERFFVYDGRSDKFKKWLEVGPRAILWSQRSVSWADVDIEKDIETVIIRTIFEHSKKIELE